ncbi:hypothetical protein LOAG_00400 [Loa loa]|uniref:Uncharacterized protein n=1 Tax=Loa loa TaxID=7209 RepID=A0A1S0UDE7_LOALO|nr:hypothetical protein LOAG_00400 [Loa loa]EFO28088.1 hypothetical protein LOAG_00400 [Loa loa]
MTVEVASALLYSQSSGKPRAQTLYALKGEELFEEFGGEYAQEQITSGKL